MSNDEELQHFDNEFARHAKECVLCGAEGHALCMTGLELLKLFQAALNRSLMKPCGHLGE